MTLAILLSQANNSYIVALDILDKTFYDDSTGAGTIAEGVYILNRETQALTGVASPVDGTSLEGVWGAPTFWGDDDYVNMQTFQAATTYPYRVPIDSSWTGDPGSAELVFPGDTVFPVIHRAARRDLTATLDVSTTTFDFGTADTNTTVTRTLTLTNSGNRDIDISNMTISGSSAFSQNCTNALLPRGATVSISIRFQPETAGTLIATFTIDSDADTPSTAVSLSGTGQVAAVSYDGTATVVLFSVMTMVTGWPLSTVQAHSSLPGPRRIQA